MKLTDTHKDILLAGAIGDAVGYIIEFRKYWQIIKDYGPAGLTLNAIHPASTLMVSDDTQMTLFALEALHLNKVQTNDQEICLNQMPYYESYLQWLYTQDSINKITSKLGSFQSMQFRRAPGNTCLGALGKPLPHSIPVNDSKGCGGIMRTAPFGFLESPTDAFNLGKMQAAITHGHPSGYYSAGAFSMILSYILYSKKTFNEILDIVMDFLDTQEGTQEVTGCIYMARNLAENPEGNIVESIHTIGGGWTGEEALGIAIFSVLKAKSFEEAIQISINHDGDSDSTGLLAGQLYAALIDLPEEYKSWSKRLDIKEAYDYVIDENNYRVQE